MAGKKTKGGNLKLPPNPPKPKFSPMLIRAKVEELKVEEKVTMT